MMAKAQEYFKKLYCPAVADRVLPILIYSGVCQKFVQFEERNETRYRLNVLLQWEFGWWKSSILTKVASWFPFRCNEITTASASALRGSFADGKFYVPELLLSDLMIFPELTALLKNDEETIGALLIALEEANVRIALVKGAKLLKSEEARVVDYGAQMVDDRLQYRNRSIVWSGTHTIDNIPDALRDALLSRFYVCGLQPHEIPDYSGFKDPKLLIDDTIENEIATWIRDILERKTEPDHSFAEKVIDRYKEKYCDNPRKRPREVGDMRRLTLAHHDIFPEESVDDCAKMIRRYVSTYAGLTSRETIAQFIYNNPRSFDEIQSFTGLKKANIMGHLKRMGALKTGIRPLRYYINQIPLATAPVRKTTKKVEKDDHDE